MSLSARRAWIEINVGFPIAAFLLVALRKESVDRNIRREMSLMRPYASLSARRAWIEIYAFLVVALLAVVALRKESVDRNIIFRL